MTSTDRLADWITLVDEHYPERDAADWDHTGLQVGDPADAVTRILVCLDVTAATLEEAERQRCDLVLAHHPLLFRPLEALTPDTAAGRLTLRAARQRTAVLSAHSNLDVAERGTSDPIVDALDLVDVRPLVAQPEPSPGSVKLVTFVPHADTHEVLAAVSAAGAGVIGEYDQCSFRVAGTGTFRPSPAANPAAGQRGQRNEEAEDRLEVVVPRARLPEVIAALWDAHPYEEVAYDLYRLEDPPASGGQAASGKGFGRVGELAESTPLRDVADRLAEGLPAPHLRVAGGLDRPVRRVAACGGAGDSFIGAALAAGADVYVTGDLRHHPTLDALVAGLALIDAGHYASEAPALAAFQRTLAQAASERGLGATLLASTVRTEPWELYQPPRKGEA